MERDLIRDLVVSGGNQSAKMVAEDLVRKRKNQPGSEIDDETWFRSAYHLVHRSEIPGADAFQAFHTHFKPARTCGTDWYKHHRQNFDLDSHLETRDLSTLNYAIRRQIELLQDPPSQEFSDSVMNRIANIADQCPDQETSELAKKLNVMIGQQANDR